MNQSQWLQGLMLRTQALFSQRSKPLTVESDAPLRLGDGAQDSSEHPRPLLAAFTAAAYERPKGAYAAVAAAAMGIEFTRLAMTGGILAVEFASASARSDESLFHGLRGGKKAMSILMTSLGMLISSLAVSLLTVHSLQPKLGSRNTLLWAFFAGSAVFAVAEFLSLIVLAASHCETSGVYDSGEWVCDRAPAVLGLGMPFIFPTLGCRVVVAWVAFKSPPDLSGSEDVAVADASAGSPDFQAAANLPKVELAPLHERDIQVADDVHEGEASLTPTLADSRKHMSKNARRSVRSRGVKTRLRNTWRHRAGDVEGSGSEDFGHARSTTYRTLLESCLEHCEDLDAEICTNSQALSGLERSVRAHQRRLDNELRRLTKAMEAQKTHRQGLEDRFQNVEARVVEYGEHMENFQAKLPQASQLPSAEITNLRRDFEQALRLTMDGLQKRCDNVGQEVQHLMTSLGLARSGHQETMLKSFRKQLVETIALPPKQQDEANKLAFRLLRQASEVAAMVCASADSRGGRVAGSRDDMQRLRSKYESTRDLHDLVRVVINEKVRQILEKPGHHSASSVHDALQDKDFVPMQEHSMQTSDTLSTCTSIRDIGRVQSSCESPDTVSKQLFLDAVQSPLSSPVLVPQFPGLPHLIRSQSQPLPFQSHTPALMCGAMYSGHGLTMSPQMPRRMPAPPQAGMPFKSVGP